MDAIITILIGLYFTAVGNRWIAASKDSAKNEEYLRKVGPMFRIGGPIIVVAGAVLLLSALVR